MKDFTKYILVNGKAPSGIPGSLVVSKDEAYDENKTIPERIFDRFNLKPN